MPNATAIYPLRNGKDVFSDEKIFPGGSNRKKTLVTRMAHERNSPSCLLVAPKHPVQVHVWGVFGWRGVGPLKLVQGSLNAQKYRETIINDIEAIGHRLVPRHRDWVFVQDQAPPHRAQATKALLAEKGVQVLDWPGNSPDLNPIENLWAHVMRSMPRKLPRNANDLFQQVQRIWHAIPLRVIRNLILSMPRRLAAVKEAQGGPTSY